MANDIGSDVSLILKPAIRVPNRFFLQYFNRDILKLYARGSSEESIFRASLSLTRIAVLLSTEPMVVPVSGLFEIGFMSRFLYAMRSVRAAGLLEYASPTPDLEEYAVKKRREYREQISLFGGYTVPVPKGRIDVFANLGWFPRIRKSSSREIGAAWKGELPKKDGLWERILSRMSSLPATVDELESGIYAVPERLDGKAFLPENAVPLLPFTVEERDIIEIDLHISRAYLISHLEEYDAMIWSDTPIGKLDCALAPYDQNAVRRTVPYRRVLELLELIGIRTSILRMRWSELLRLRESAHFRWLTRRLLEGLNVGHFEATWLRLGLQTDHLRRRVLDESSLSDWLLRLYEAFTARENAVPQLFEGGQTAQGARDVGKDGQRQLQLWRVNEEPRMNDLDVVFVIALGEEFRELWRDVSAVPSYDEVIGRYLYRFTMWSYQCEAIFVGGMGPTKAAVATRDVILRRQPRTLVNVGLAGGLDGDLRLGDVVVGKVVDSYLEDSKTVDNKHDAGFSFLLSGDPYRPRGALTTHAENLEFAYTEAFNGFLRKSEQRLAAMDLAVETRVLLTDKRLLRSSPRLLLGKIASGPTVSGSQRFSEWLKSQKDRKYLAIEMESAGVLTAAEGRDVDTFVVRGVSDFADERKPVLDGIADGGFRLLSMNNAMSFISAMMQSKLFAKA